MRECLPQNLHACFVLMPVDSAEGAFNKLARTFAAQVVGGCSRSKTGEDRELGNQIGQQKLSPDGFAMLRTWKSDSGKSPFEGAYRSSRAVMEAMMMPLSVKASDMLSADDLTLMQREQFRHDQRNHSDILCLGKPDRLKHYGLHFAKYAGRWARGPAEAKSVERTLTDTALVCLSAANTLHQRLGNSALSRQLPDLMGPLVDAAGRFADACEKIDHLEEFLQIARTANQDILNWVLAVAVERQIDLRAAIKARRKELADRQFYIVD